MMRQGMLAGSLIILLMALYWPAVQATGAATRATPEASGTIASVDSERLALIRRRGALIVGLKTDYAPFGGLNAQGQPEGLEHDLAADLARRLGVQPTKVSVTPANRLQRLEDGSIDLVIAPLGDNE